MEKTQPDDLRSTGAAPEPEPPDGGVDEGGLDEGGLDDGGVVDGGLVEGGVVGAVLTGGVVGAVVTDGSVGRGPTVSWVLGTVVTGVVGFVVEVAGTVLVVGVGNG